MARRSPRSLNAVVRNKDSVPKDLSNFWPQQNSPCFHLATHAAQEQLLAQGPT